MNIFRKGRAALAVASFFFASHWSYGATAAVKSSQDVLDGSILSNDIGSGSTLAGRVLAATGTGAASWQLIGSIYSETDPLSLHLTGGTVTGATTFSNTLTANKGLGTAALAITGQTSFTGTNSTSYINFSTTEAAYIRGGKTGATVYLNDSHNGPVSIAAGGGATTIGGGVSVTGTVTATGRVTGAGLTDTTLPSTPLLATNGSGNLIAATTPVALALGGTNNASLSATLGTVYYGDGTKVTGLVGSAGFLKSTGAAAPAWSAVNLSGSDVTGSLPWASVSKTGSSLGDLATRTLSLISDVTISAAEVNSYDPSSKTSGAVPTSDGSNGITWTVPASGGANANGYYLVSRSTNAPTNALNLGAFTSGGLKIDVASGVATVSTFTLPMKVVELSSYNTALGANAILGRVPKADGAGGITWELDNDSGGGGVPDLQEVTDEGATTSVFSTFSSGLTTAGISVTATANLNAEVNISGPLDIIHNVTATSATLSSVVVNGGDTTSGDVTLTLPTAIGNNGRIYVIYKSDSSSNDVIIDGNGSQTINGALTLTLTTQYEVARLSSDGNNWIKW